MKVPGDVKVDTVSIQYFRQPVFAAQPVTENRDTNGAGEQVEKSPKQHPRVRRGD